MHVCRYREVRSIFIARLKRYHFQIPVNLVLEEEEQDGNTHFVARSKNASTRLIYWEVMGLFMFGILIYQFGKANRQCQKLRSTTYKRIHL